MERRRVLVVSPEEARRRDWAAVVQDDRTDVATCAGPSDKCFLLAGSDGCPLVEHAHAAVYDLEFARPELLAALMQAHPRVEIVLARDRWVRGQHRPSVIVRRRPRALAFEAVV